MTPPARIAAAIGILDRILGGERAESVLTQWARSNRFAGSGDRAAIRDHVFAALRCLRSFTALSGARSPCGRAVMIGALRAAEMAPGDVFTGLGYAPAPLSAAEAAALTAAPAFSDLEVAVALDCPDWTVPLFRSALAEDFPAVLSAMRHRAPVFLRVNPRRGDRQAAADGLRAEGIIATLHPKVKYAMEVIEDASKIRNSLAYLAGVVEIQDLSPQAAVEALPLRSGMRVLDYCAGGGGKVLAMAASCDGDFTAHDANEARMHDIPGRADRAGVSVKVSATGALWPGAYDLVLLDVPCSGSGTWRRDPDAKWRLSGARLDEMVRLQAGILDKGAALAGPGGYLAYMTCSLFACENRAQIDAFLARHPGWRLAEDRSWTPLSGGDGFYSALLTRA